MIIHIVQKGDSIYTISRKYGVPMQKIMNDNSIDTNQTLVIGQALVIITNNIRHTVTAGESLYLIAKRYNTTVAKILAANPSITDPSKIYVGQVVVVPVSTPKLGTILANGYAFPNINRTTLGYTLPFLSFNAIFSYQVRPDGSLVPIVDQPIIEQARAARVAPLMVITNIKEGGSFDSNLAHTILSSEQVQNTLLNNVVNTLSKGYYGLDIDFEYIFPEDREKYNDFIRKTVNRLRPLGYTISTALAPKTSANQVGLLYQAHDYPVHGALVDHVIIMTYEWGYTYGPPMAVAPIDQVERVLQYAVSAIPRNKILMGMPNYGYDWTLPYVRGTAARSLSNNAAVKLAARVGAEIQYDTKSQAPFFTYYDSNKKQHIVWFEDPRSVQAKLNLVNKYGLEGVSVWTINTFFPQLWLVMDSMYNIRKLL